MYKFFLSIKFLTHRLVNWISVVCVALAVTVLLVVMAVMGGFHTELLRAYQSISSDLVMDVDRLRGVPYESVRERILETPHVLACARRFYAYGVIGGEQKILKGGTAGIKIFGVDPQEERTATQFFEHLCAPEIPEDLRVRDLDHPFDTTPYRDPDSRPRPGIIVGDDLLLGLGSRLGDVLVLGAAAFAEEDEVEEPGQRVKMREMTFQVVGAFSSGMYEFDAHTVFIPRRFEIRDDWGTEVVDVEADFLESGGGHEIYVRLDDYRNASKVRSDLYGRLPGAIIQTWEERHRTFLSAVETEKAIQAVILSLMIVLAAGSIMAVLTMTVVEKTRDIGTIKALGGTVGGILQVFLLNGFVIALVGSILGIALGILIIDNINFIDEQIVAKVIGHEIFRKDIYIFDDIPTEKDIPSMAWTVGLTLVASLAASLVPAWKASKYRPVEALRYE